MENNIHSSARGAKVSHKPARRGVMTKDTIGMIKGLMG